MIAAEPAAVGGSRGGNAGGHSRNARKRDWLPWALRPPLPPALRSRKDRWPPQAPQVRDRKMTNRQLALANAALLSSAVGLKRSFRRHAVIRQGRKPRTRMRSGWLARTAFVFALTR